MTQKKLVISFIIFLLILFNLGAIAFAALPFLQGNSIQLGLKLLPATKTPVTDADIEKSIAVIRTRLEKLNGNAVLVERSKVAGEEITVRIPATMDLAQAKEVIVEPGHLALKLVAQKTQIPFPTQEAAAKAFKTLNSAAFEILPFKDSFKEEGGMTGFIIVERKPVITNADLRAVRANISVYNDSSYQIDFSLTPDGAARLSKATGEHIGDQLAIVLNNEVKSAPTISGQISDRGQISGDFSKRAAERMAVTLSSGELPHEISIVSEKVISATEQAKVKGFRIGVFGFTLLLLLGSFIYVVRR
jgi:protein-export membrane protein SecD